MSKHHKAWLTIVKLGIAALWAAALAGCAVDPERPFTGRPPAGAPAGAPCAPPAALDRADAARVTPELGTRDPYTLHFVEFDDQGWMFPDGVQGGAAATPSRQIDCAIADLRHKLASNENILSFVYVHGWKHSAANDDPDLQTFRRLLATRAELFPDRRVVGIYVAWQGNTIDVWGLKNITFWGRKNAAHHVADGRVRELFSRLHGLRAHWNGPAKAEEHACDWQPSGNDRCRLRTVMIGHSFGGLILYNSAAPYLLEMLSIHRDLPDDIKPPPAARAVSIADLIVLLNPAFEGSRYEPLFEASRHYRAEDSEPPWLVMLTSTADWATKNAFPVARWFNSIFQYPASSDAQSSAMRRTPGHIDHYLTHELCLASGTCGTQAPPAPGADAGRRYCGGLLLRPSAGASTGPRPIVWNIRTNGDIIASHNDIAGPHVFRFVAQVYGDITGLPADACDDQLKEPAAAGAAAAPALTAGR